MICAEGGAGLLAALPSAYPGVPVQRFRTHKSVTGDALVSCAGYPLSGVFTRSEVVYADVDPALKWAAEWSVRAQLEYLS